MIAPNPQDWTQYDPSKYTDWLKNNTRRIRSNYPDFDFNDDLTAEIYTKDDASFQQHPVDVHKLMHPAWYLASRSYNGPLDTTQAMMNKLRQLYHMEISQLFNSSAANGLLAHKESIKSWLREEASRGTTEHSDDTFHKLLNRATIKYNNTTINPDAEGLAPLDLFNAGVFDVVDNLIDTEHPLNRSNENPIEFSSFEAKGPLNLQVTKNQIFRLVLAYKLELYFVMQSVLAEAMGAESLSLTIVKKDGKHLSNIHLNNISTKTIPDFARYIKLLSQATSTDPASIETELDAIRNSEDGSSTTNVIVQALTDLQLEIIRMCNTNNIDDTLKTFGLLDTEADTLNIEMDKKLAAQRNSDWEDNFIKAFPTFKLFIIEEDSNQWRLFDDFYSYDAVHSIDIVESKHAASSTAIIRLSNVTGRLSTPGVESFAYDTTDLNASLKTINIKPGTTIMVRMGYGPDYRNLPVSFYGSITETNPGPVLEIKAQSFGAELLQSLNEEMELTNKNGHDSMGQVVMTILDKTPGLRHFGRWQIYHDKISGATSSSTLNNAFKIANFGFLAGIGLGDIGSDVLKKLGIDESGLGILGSATDLIQGWKEQTNKYSMLLNFGNPLYDNIYVNNKNPRYYGFLGFLVGGLKDSNLTEGNFKWSIGNQTAWDALWELALYHGDYIVRPLPYNEGANIFGDQAIRNTLYFGPREGMYKAMDDPYSFNSDDTQGRKQFRKMYTDTLSLERARNSSEVSVILAELIRKFITPRVDEAYTKSNFATMRDNHASNPLAWGGRVLSSIADVGREIIGLDEQDTEIETMMGQLAAIAPNMANLAKKYLTKIYEERRGGNERAYWADYRTSVDKRTVLGSLILNLEPLKYGSQAISEDQQFRLNLIMAQQLGASVGLNPKLYQTDISLKPVVEALKKYTAEWLDAVEQDIEGLVTNAAALNLRQDLGKVPAVRNLLEYADALGITNVETYRPIVEHHAASSATNIIANDIRATGDSMSNKVTVWHPDAGENSSSANEWPRDIEHRKVSVLSYELDTNYIREYVSFQKNAGEDIHVVHNNAQTAAAAAEYTDDPNTYSLPIAQEIADQILLNQMKGMYQGSLTLTGNSGIRPYHLIHIMDTVHQMDGIVEVEEVVHSLNPETGFTTTIKPNLYCTMRHNKSMVDSQIIDYQQRAAHWTRTLVSVGKGAWKSAETYSTLALIGGGASLLGGSGLSWGLLAGGTYAAPIVAASLAVGAVSGIATYQDMQMKQYLNSILLHHGNAPIVIAPLHHRNNPYVAGVEGIINFNKDIGTVAYDRLFVNMWQADLLKAFAGSESTISN